MYSVKNVAEILGLTIGAVYELIWCGKLKAIDVGKGDKKACYRIEKSEVEAFKRRFAVQPRITPEIDNKPVRVNQVKPAGMSWREYLYS